MSSLSHSGITLLCERVVSHVEVFTTTHPLMHDLFDTGDRGESIVSLCVLVQLGPV